MSLFGILGAIVYGGPGDTDGGLNGELNLYIKLGKVTVGASVLVLDPLERRRLLVPAVNVIYWFCGSIGSNRR